MKRPQFTIAFLLGLVLVSGLAFVVARQLGITQQRRAIFVPTAKIYTSVGPAPPAAKSYKLVGVVRKVDRETGVVSIRHEAIPGFMPAMTMPFDLKGQEILDDLQPGDKVEGTLQVNGDDSKLVDLNITKMATPTAPAPAAKPVLKAGEPVPDFAMTTLEGKTLRFSDLRGKVVVMTFIYTRCPLPNFCPAQDQRFARLAGLLKAVPQRAEHVRLLSVSFDPEHDTPEVLARHAKLRGASPPLWTFAVASHDELRKVAEPLGLTYGPTPNEIIHNLLVAVVSPDGTLARLEPGSSWTPEELFRAVARLTAKP